MTEESEEEVRGDATADTAEAQARAMAAEIAEHLGTAAKAVLAAQESQRFVESTRADVEAKVALIVEAASQAAAAKEKIASDQAVIASKSQHIQEAQDHADGVRSNLDRALTAATQHATEAEGLRARAQTAMTTIDELLAAVRSSKGAVDADAAAIAAAKQGAQTAFSTLKGVVEKANSAKEKVEAYEGRLAELETQCKAQLETITGLLPGATSAGLAHAFDARRKTFLEPAKLWQYLFIGSIALLVAVAGTGLYQAYRMDPSGTYDGLWRLWLARLPVGGALVWLAIHAAREAALAKRLEEDYGYKAAVAASFLGFNEQMSKLATEAKPDSPLAKLCSDTLATIAAPPGRIYDKHRLAATPADGLKDILQTLVEREGASAEKAKP